VKARDIEDHRETMYQALAKQAGSLALQNPMKERRWVKRRERENKNKQK
jgi:hypothetical protein